MKIFYLKVKRFQKLCKISGIVRKILKILRKISGEILKKSKEYFEEIIKNLNDCENLLKKLLSHYSGILGRFLLMKLRKIFANASYKNYLWWNFEKIVKRFRKGFWRNSEEISRKYLINMLRILQRNSTNSFETIFTKLGKYCFKRFWKNLKIFYENCKETDRLYELLEKISEFWGYDELCGKWRKKYCEFP